MNIDNITSDSMTLTYNGKAMLIKVYEQEIERLNKENEQLRTELNSKESIINKAIEVIDLVKPELWNISNKMTYRLLDIKNILAGDDKK